MTFIKQLIAGQASLNSYVVVERRVRLGKKFVKKLYSMTLQKFGTGYNNVKLKNENKYEREELEKVSVLTLKHCVHATIEQQVLFSTSLLLDIVGYHLSYCYQKDGHTKYSISSEESP